MRKIMFLLVCAGLMFLVWSNLAMAYPRTVLMEDYTNWG